MTDPLQLASSYQQRFFEILDEFFARATGSSVAKFATFDTFGSTIRSRAEDIAPRGEAAYRWIAEELANLYADEAGDAFAAACQLGGMRLVLGGGSRFKASQLDSVSQSLLYADTILIPDPVMPWLEKDREEERFRHVLMLEAVFGILHIKPLVDANFRYPAVMVFPSWEKLLEDHDAETQQGISTLIGDFFSHFLGESLSTFEEVAEFAQRHPERFLQTVETSQLFVAPGGNIGEPIAQTLEKYEAAMATWRSPDWQSQFEPFPVAHKVFYAITERLGAQYHLLENSEELGAHPLLPLAQQSHYFKLVSATNSARLEHLGLLDSKQKSLIDGLSQQRLKWLSNVPVESLVEIRRNNENVQFRQRLESVIARIHDATVNDSSRVAAELSQEIASAMADHDRAMERLQKEFNRKHAGTAVAGWIACAAALMPTIAPFLASWPHLLWLQSMRGIKSMNELHAQLCRNR